MDTICGIYSIKNIKNGREYIGSSIHVPQRIADHKDSLKRKSHTNNILQNDWNSYGESWFEFSLLEQCDKDELVYKEQYYIDKANSMLMGYNQSPSKLILCRNSKNTLKRQTYYLKEHTIEALKKLSKQSEMGISEVLQALLDKVLDNVEVE